MAIDNGIMTTLLQIGDTANPENSAKIGYKIVNGVVVPVIAGTDIELGGVVDVDLHQRLEDVVRMTIHVICYKNQTGDIDFHQVIEQAKAVKHGDEQ